MESGELWNKTKVNICRVDIADIRNTFNTIGQSWTVRQTDSIETRFLIV